MAYTPEINSLLSRLLPQGWQSQVSATFAPKRYDTFSAGDFTPDLSGDWADRPSYDSYRALLDAGYRPTAKGYDLYAGTDVDFGGLFDIAKKANYRAKVTGSLFDPTDPNVNPADFSEYWVHPDEMEDINVFDPGSLRAGFERAGLPDAHKGMFTPFQASDLRALDPSTYTAQMEKDRANLASSLQDRLGIASGIGGGFAGYGGRSSAKDLALQKYEQGAEGLYADINKQRAGAIQGLYSKLEDYDKLISQAT